MENRYRVNADDIVATREAWFYPETYRFYHDGVRKLRSVLTEVRGEFTHAMEVFGIDDSAFKELDSTIARLDSMIAWGETQLKRKGDVILPRRTTYGELRLFKAGGILQVREYEQLRASLLCSRDKVPKSLLKAIDDRLRQMKDRLEQGVLNGLLPADIFLELELARRGDGEASDVLTAPVTRPTIVVESDELPIVDDHLRERCLDLLRSFDGSAEATRLDTVVREMSVILEDRVRTVAGIKDKLNPEKLMVAAFSGTSPKLVFSTDQDVQQSAYLLFKGYVGFFRNEAMHRLVATYTRERLYQLLGYVDLLLFLLTQAQLSSKSEQEPNGEANESTS